MTTLEGATAAPPAAETLDTVLASRRSCRAFLAEPVPADVLRRLFTMAQRTPSWCNSQAWQVHLLGGDELTRLGELLVARAQAGGEVPDIPPPARYEGVYRDRRYEVGKALNEAVGISREDKAARARQTLENFRFFGAPHHAIITTPKSLGTYGAVDCGAYVSTLLTVAESFGLGAIAQGAIAMYSDVLRVELGLSEDRWVVCGVSLGYADPSHPANGFRAQRAALGEVVSGLPPG